MVSKTHHVGSMFDDTSRGILEAILIAGGMTLALSVAPTAVVALAGIGYVLKAEDKERHKRIRAGFGYLSRKKYIQAQTSDSGLRIVVTSKGRREIQQHLLKKKLSEPIGRPRVWDKKWRIILFDVPSGERSKRNAFRSFIRREGAVMLQKSVWVHPFDCSENVVLLRQFFHFSNDQLRLIVTDSVGSDAHLKKHFKL